MVIVEKLVELRLAGETEVLGENLSQHHFVHHNFPTLIKFYNLRHVSVIKDRLQGVYHIDENFTTHIQIKGF
jgi:hypothetical protein